MRKLSSLSPFGNLSCCVLFSVDLFFWRIEPPRYFVTLKAPAIFTPRSRAIKKPYGASLKDKYKKMRIEADTFAQAFLQNIRES